MCLAQALQSGPGGLPAREKSFSHDPLRAQQFCENSGQPWSLIACQLHAGPFVYAVDLWHTLSPSLWPRKQAPEYNLPKATQSPSTGPGSKPTLTLRHRDSRRSNPRVSFTILLCSNSCPQPRAAGKQRWEHHLPQLSSGPWMRQGLDGPEAQAPPLPVL